jgi:hypothetical protein
MLGQGYESDENPETFTKMEIPTPPSSYNTPQPVLTLKNSVREVMNSVTSITFVEYSNTNLRTKVVNESIQWKSLDGNLLIMVGDHMIPWNDFRTLASVYLLGMWNLRCDLKFHWQDKVKTSRFDWSQKKLGGVIRDIAAGYLDLRRMNRRWLFEEVQEYILLLSGIE